MVIAIDVEYEISGGRARHEVWGFADELPRQRGDRRGDGIVDHSFDLGAAVGVALQREDQRLTWTGFDVADRVARESGDELAAGVALHELLAVDREHAIRSRRVERAAEGVDQLELGIVERAVPLEVLPAIDHHVARVCVGLATQSRVLAPRAITIANVHRARDRDREQLARERVESRDRTGVRWGLVARSRAFGRRDLERHGLDPRRLRGRDAREPQDAPAVRVPSHASPAAI